MGKRIGVMLVLGVSLILGFGVYFRTFSHKDPTTASKGDLAREATAQKEERISAEGRIVACPDGEVLLRSEYAGTLNHYPVRELQMVKKGDLIASIRATDIEAQLSKGTASLDLADARLVYAEKQFHRDQRLRRTRTISLSSFDRTRKNYEIAKALKEKALATIQLYQAILSKTRILAPINGVIIARFHNQGEYVKVGSRIVTIADLDRTQVDAEIDEFDAGRVHISAPVTIRADGYRTPWKGVVVSVSDSVSRKHLIPDDPSRPTDTGVVHVKIAPISRLPFKLGQKVDIRIHTKIQGGNTPFNTSKITRCSGE